MTKAANAPAPLWPFLGYRNADEATIAVAKAKPWLLEPPANRFLGNATPA
jgi:hypothetical protein